jgi:NAD(P)-dependent dehydrogenase (short-subunit alcohol dehydrogenase family)
MTGILEGRVAIVTGAGRGLGREHALELVRQGAHVVVNDYGVSLGGEGTEDTPAHEVVAETVTNRRPSLDFLSVQLVGFGWLIPVLGQAGYEHAAEIPMYEILGPRSRGSLLQAPSADWCSSSWVSSR